MSRDEVTKASFFGTQDYSREKLVAEFTAACLCNHAGIDSTREQSATYVASWLRAFQDDVKMAVWAAGRAQRAADFILGVSPDDAEASLSRKRWLLWNSLQRAEKGLETTIPFLNWRAAHCIPASQERSPRDVDLQLSTHPHPRTCLGD